MPRPNPLFLVMLVPALAACLDAAPPTAPELARRVVGGEERLVQMMDACDPETFNAALGPGTCVRNGGVRLEDFLEALGKHQKVGSWNFAPATVHVRVGQTLVAPNQGGEVHTFTEVAAFGGGFIQLLNDLSGTPVPAPECLGLPPETIIPAGGEERVVVDEAGTQLYQCCLHPWMRAVVHASP